VEGVWKYAVIPFVWTNREKHENPARVVGVPAQMWTEYHWTEKIDLRYEIRTGSGLKCVSLLVSTDTTQEANSECEHKPSSHSDICVFRPKPLAHNMATFTKNPAICRALCSVSPLRVITGTEFISRRRCFSVLPERRTPHEASLFLCAPFPKLLQSAIMFKVQTTTRKKHKLS
jgi:hypothetical protein